MLMRTSPSTQAPFPSLRQVPSAVIQTPSPFLAFLPSQHHSHKSAVKCCLSAHAGKLVLPAHRLLIEGMRGTNKVFLNQEIKNVECEYSFGCMCARVLKQPSQGIMLF